MNKKIKFLSIFIFIILIMISKNIYAAEDKSLTNATRVYFNSEITKNYGNGDCILLENYDANGNKIYGLIDTGRNISKDDKDGQKSTVVKEYLKNHGVEKLEFLGITHSHGDHNGDALTVLDNFKVDTIYMKEYDAKWSPDGTQGRYEDIIERAVAKNIKVVGVSYLSLTSSEISPSRSTDFINNTKDAKKELFESFNENNITFKFGSSTIKIFNWEMFDEKGNQYITGVTTNATREIDTNENNNSITFLLTQGNKKAFFSGDMNNLDEDKENGRIGDEDRLKNQIGKVDFLKLGHHGYKYSNTEDYINVLKPEYAVITNDIGGIYKDIAKWLEENNVNYLYTTSDTYGVSATISDDNIYLGFETTGEFKKIGDGLYYIPEGDEYKYTDYTKSAYKLKYEEKNIEANNWKELKEKIENNKKEFVKIDSTSKTCTLYKLIINLKNGGDWTATEAIEIEPQQQVVLKTSDNITALRGTDFKDSPLFLVKGTLTIGQQDMAGTIKIDGNKSNVEAKATLIKIEEGTLNLDKNSTLCNNLNKTTSRTNASTTIDYTSFGSAIYAKKGTININGGNIVNNSQDVALSHTLPKNVVNYYRYSTMGAGIYMCNNSILNMYSGKINDNEAQNHSIVTTNSDYTKSERERGLLQNCLGVGIYANNNSEVNLMGGEISGNSAKNYATTTLKKATNENEKTTIYSVNDGIYGTGIDIDSGKLKISNNFNLSNNTAELNSKIIIEEDVLIINSANFGIRGLEAYINNSNALIDGATISNGQMSNNTEVTNNGTIGTAGTSSVSKTDCGGGLDIISNCVFDIKNLTITNCNSGNGGGLYISSSKGTIANSNISNNKVTENGGGIFTYKSDVKIKNTTISKNEAKFGGGIYIGEKNSNTELKNIKINENTTTQGSGGGIYAYGNLIISGDNTVISNNTAGTYGGGIMVKTKAILNAGEISNNRASTYAGGGIRVDGKLIMNGGTVKNNTAKTTGGGIDYTTGKMYLTSGTIENNIAETEGKEIYPVNNISTDTIKPTIEISEIPKTWTNKNILVSIIAKDDETDIKTVTINGETISGNDNVYNYEIQENGTYNVIATDYAGNTETKEFTITHIDRDMPIITGAMDNGVYKDTRIINATDLKSGIKKVILLKDNKQVEYKLGEKISQSGNYTIIVEDNVSNKNTITFKIDRTLKDDEIEIEGLSKKWTNQNQVITISINNEIKSIKINNKEVALENGKYKLTATSNTQYKIEIVDYDGNTKIKTIDVSNIDKTPPTIYGATQNKTYNEEVTLNIRDEESGISSIIINNNGEKKTYNKNQITLSENGVYQIQVTDNAGNVETKRITIDIYDEDDYYDEDEEYEDEDYYDEDSFEEDEYYEEDEGDDAPEYYDDEDEEFEEYEEDDYDYFGEDEEIEEEKNYQQEILEKILPDTGKKVFGTSIIILIVVSVVFFIKTRRYKEI